MGKRQIQAILSTIEQALTGAEHTPKPSPGKRVTYVATKGGDRDGLTLRAAQIMGFFDSHARATSVALQKAYRVNRNVIAGAIHELKQRGLVATLERRQHFQGGAAMAAGSAAGSAADRPTRKRSGKKRGR